jgi:hypothetical protein
MAKSKSKSLPKFQSFGKLVEFFDTQDMGDYLGSMPEVDFDIHIKKRTHVIAIEEDVANQLNELAKSKHIRSQTLVDKWLREKIAEQAKA